jgi:exosome complex component CSL4
MRTEKVIIPGEKLGSIEEGESGEGTYEEDGNVRAQVIGTGGLDLKSRVFTMTPLREEMPIPRINEDVIARVVSVQNTLATLEIIRAGDRVLGRTFTGLLYQKRAAKTLIRTLRNLVKPGDIMRGRVTYNKSPIQISTIGSNCGVILANCSKCGGKLERMAKSNFLVCQNCGWRETRLIAPDYGEPKW